VRVAVLTAAVPFGASPARGLAAELVSALEQLDHSALVVTLPLPGGPLPAEHVLAIRALRLPNVDRAIALGFPACAVPHVEKVVWLPADDMWCPYGCYLRESRAVYAASAGAVLRLRAESGVKAAALAPPPAGATWRHVAEILTA
jgi:hypothetical protein